MDSPSAASIPPKDPPSSTSPKVDSVPLRPQSTGIFSCASPSPSSTLTEPSCNHRDQEDVRPADESIGVPKNSLTDIDDYRQTNSPDSLPGNQSPTIPIINDIGSPRQGDTNDDFEQNQSNVTADFQQLSAESEDLDMQCDHVPADPPNPDTIVSSLVSDIVGHVAQEIIISTDQTSVASATFNTPSLEDIPPSTPSLTPFPHLPVFGPEEEPTPDSESSLSAPHKKRAGKRKRRKNKKHFIPICPPFDNTDMKEDIVHEEGIIKELFKEPGDIDDPNNFNISDTLNSTMMGSDFESHCSQSFLRSPEDNGKQSPREDSFRGEKSKLPPTPTQEEKRNEEQLPPSPRRGTRDNSWADESTCQDDSFSSTQSKKRKRRTRKKTSPSSSPPIKTSRTGIPATQTNVVSPPSQFYNSNLNNSKTMVSLGTVPKQRSSTFTQPASLPPLATTKTNTTTQMFITQQIQKRRAMMPNTTATFNYNIQRYNNPPTKSVDVVKIRTSETNPTELFLPDIISDNLNVSSDFRIISKGTVPFVIIFRPADSADSRWDIPSLQTARDFMSRAQCTLIDLDMDYHTVINWCNPWGNIPLLGLLTNDLDKLSKFRTFVSTLRFQNLHFNTFIKEAMVANMDITVLLKTDYREIDVQKLPAILFAHNDLHGALDIPKHEDFVEGDTTRSGISKQGWKLLTLVGDEIFLDSLSHFTENHWFNIGVGSIQIRGGQRKEESDFDAAARKRRRRSNITMITKAASNLLNNSVADDFIDEAAATAAASAAAMSSYVNPAGSSNRPPSKGWNS